MADKIKVNEINLCNWEKFSCFGCCGHHYTTEKEVRDGIRRNTLNFKSLMKSPDKEEKLKYLRHCGICHGVIIVEENGIQKAVCGLHPFQHKGTDHRDSVCDKEYLCKSFYFFRKVFDDRQKERFLEFLREKNADWYEYSIKMDDNSYLNEFLDKEKLKFDVPEKERYCENE